jgi:integrase
MAKRVQDGSYVPVGRRNVSDYLGRWLDTLSISGRRSTTIAAYRWLVTKHIDPELGDIVLRDLTALEIDRLYGVMTDKGLALRTVRHCYSVLRRALQDAVDKGLLASNPAVKASPPKVSATRAPEHLDAGRAGHVLGANQGPQLGCADPRGGHDRATAR